MDTDEAPEPITLNLPPLPDELAATLCELLQDLLDGVEARYFHQVRAYYQERDRAYRERQAEMYFQSSQQSLPLEDTDTF